MPSAPLHKLKPVVIDNWPSMRRYLCRPLVHCAPICPRVFVVVVAAHIIITVVIFRGIYRYCCPVIVNLRKGAMLSVLQKWGVARQASTLTQAHAPRALCLCELRTQRR